MKNIFLVLLLTLSITAQSQSVFGYWYGIGNVKTKSSSNNYLVELVLQPEVGFVKAVLNYYFKNTFRSFQVKGNYDTKTRQLRLYNIPVTYFGSITNLEVDCIMNMQATLRVAVAGSSLVGAFVSLPDHKYVCTDIGFNLSLNADASKQDSVLNAIKNYKETNQVWKPEIEDTLVAATVIQRKVINYVTEKEFAERKKETAQVIEVSSDSLKIDVYDNGEVDGDIISIFFNNQLILNRQKLTHKSIHLDIVLDKNVAVNELSMFAENTGLIPPNTALMIIKDQNDNRYEVKVSSNLDKTSSILFKRKQIP